MKLIFTRYLVGVIIVVVILSIIAKIVKILVVMMLIVIIVVIGHTLTTHHFATRHLLENEYS